MKHVVAGSSLRASATPTFISDARLKRLAFDCSRLRLFSRYRAQVHEYPTVCLTAIYLINDVYPEVSLLVLKQGDEIVEEDV